MTERKHERFQTEPSTNCALTYDDKAYPLGRMRAHPQGVRASALGLVSISDVDIR